MNQPGHQPIKDQEEQQPQERILLSDGDWQRFVQMMTEDSGPTETAVEEAKAFNQGQFDGSRYRW